MLAAVNTSLTPCAYFPRRVHAERAVARFQRGFVPGAANFLRLLLVAHFRGAKNAPARASFGIEDRKCAEPEMFARLTTDSLNLRVFLGKVRRPFRMTPPKIILLGIFSFGANLGREFCMAKVPARRCPPIVDLRTRYVNPHRGLRRLPKRYPIRSRDIR